MAKKNISATIATDSIALSTTFSKKQVPQLIEQLQKKLQVLKGGADEKIDTSIMYETGEKINEIKEVSKLLQISASIHARENAYKQEITRYNLTTKNIATFSVNGKNVKQWEEIINKAIIDLINKNEITKVENAIDKLSKHLDEKVKLQNELAEIMASATSEIV